MNRRGVLLSAVSLAAVTTAEAVTPGRLLTVLTGKRAAVNPYTLTYSTDFTTATSLPAWLTHTRGSLATMTDANGYLTYAPNNLLTYSNTFSNGVWTVWDSTLTGGQADPVGGTNAWLIQAKASGLGEHFLRQDKFTLLGKHIVWAEVKASGYDYASFRATLDNNGSYKNCGFNLTNGTVTGGTLGTGAVTDLGNGWYRISVAVDITIAGAFRFQLDTCKNAVTNDTAPGFTGDDVSGFIVYRTGVSAVTYETTPRPQDQVITTSAAYYGPRINSSGLLIEEARTNIFTYSEDVSSWTGKTGFTPSSTTLTNGVKGTSFASMPNYGIYDAIGSAWIVNETARPAVDASGRGKVTFTTPAGCTSIRIYLLRNTSSTYAQNTITVTPSTTYTLTWYEESGKLGGVQLEAGSFATSYIPTTAAVTRAADIVQIVGAGLGVLQGTQGSALIELGAYSKPRTEYPFFLSGSTPPYLLFDNNGPLSLRPSTGSDLNNSNVMNFSPSATSLRLGAAWGVSGRSISGKGQAVASDSTVIGAISSMYVGSSGSYCFINGYVSKLALYNHRLPDATLQAKTVLGATL